jgi:isopenicillin-N epimerase
VSADAGLSDWALDPDVIQLNHGSFGATPVPVLAEQDRWRREFEANPTGFVVRVMEPAIDAARAALASLVGADVVDLVFLTNATMGVNTVIRSLDLDRGDELLTTDHTYNACRNVLDHVAVRTGSVVVTAPVPFPLDSPEEVVASILGAATERTRFALLDHVTSPTGLVLPIEEVIRPLEAAGVRVMIDGAHGPGMVPLDLSTLGASYYTGNCHKWLCSPKGSGFLWARRGLADSLIPPVISHGWNDPRTERPRFHLLFDYMGADDPTAHLALPAAIEFLSMLHPHGLPGLMERNRRLALEVRTRLCDLLQIEAPAPDSMIGSLAAVPLPDAWGEPVPGFIDPLGPGLFERHRIQIPVFIWPSWPRRNIRISAAPYNTLDDYDPLLEALRQEL